jgi:hypothetical protein
MRHCLMLLFASMSFWLSAQELRIYTAEDLQAMYTEHLGELGLDAVVDEDGDVVFRFEGKTFMLRVDELDPWCFRVVLANIWSVETEQDRQRAYRAMERTNALSKVAKAYLVEDQVWLSAESLLPTPEDHRAVLGRSMEALVQALGIFVRALRG